MGPKAGPEGSLGRPFGSLWLALRIFWPRFLRAIGCYWHPFGVLWAPLLILGCLSGALCISWVLLGPSLEILAFLQASPCIFLVFLYYLSNMYKHMQKSAPRLGGKTYGGCLLGVSWFPLLPCGVPGALLKKLFANAAGINCSCWHLDFTGVRGLYVHLIPKVFLIPKSCRLECFRTPTPLGLPWSPKLLPMVPLVNLVPRLPLAPKVFWLILAGFVDLLGALSASLGTPLGILGCRSDAR